jgi:hypothetical protein
MVWDCNPQSRGVFTVAVSGGSGSYTYQWYFNLDGGTTGYPLTDSRYVVGSTTATLTVTPDQQRTVWCEITDPSSGNTVTSNHVLHDLSRCNLNVTQQPVGMVWDCNPQSRGVFTVAVSGGSGSYTYQWYFNLDGGTTGYPLTDSRYVVGSTTATLTVTPDQQRTVWCEITDPSSGNTVTSNHVLHDLSRCPQ